MKFDLGVYLDPRETARVSVWAKAIASGKADDPLAFRESKKCDYGIDRTTLRAIPAHSPAREPKPSVILRAWAADQYNRLDQVPLRSRADFERWHASMVRSVAMAWKKNGASLALQPHAPYKVVDLFVKWLVRHLPDGSARKKRLARWAHAPLDKKSLAILNDAYGGILLLRGDDCRMGAISSPSSYRFHQVLIAALAAECGTTALMFDCYAWDEFDRRYPAERKSRAKKALRLAA